MSISQPITEKIALVNKFILNPIILLMFAVALLYFFVGVFQMIYNAESDEGRETGRKHMFYGIIGLFVMISVYGIVRLLLATFDIETSGYIF